MITILILNCLFSEVINAKSIVTSTQAPVVAKVLTNAQGQVISVGSLLAHQKQHGSLPQGKIIIIILFYSILNIVVNIISITLLLILKRYQV